MIRINRIIRVLIASDFIFHVGVGFMDPIFAVFLVESITGGTVQLVGTAAAIYWFTKSVLRLPIAYFLDKKRGEYDDFYSMLAGFFIITGLQFTYLLAQTPNHIYIIQVFMGVGGALAYTPWYGFFSRHIDKYRENMEWSISNSSVGFGIAGAGFLAGFVAEHFGFAPIFIISGILSFFGTLLLLFIGKNVQLKKRDGFSIR